MKRLAAPMVVGVFSAMLLTLLVIPAIYAFWRWHSDLKKLGNKRETIGGDTL